MAGGYGQIIFKPNVQNLRLGYEGLLNATKPMAASVATVLAGKENTLAGRVAQLNTAGEVELSDGTKPIGLFADNLPETEASKKATFYFRGGEYYVKSGLIDDLGGTLIPQINDELVANAQGMLKVRETGVDDGKPTVGRVVYVGEYALGNMYEHAPMVEGSWVGFILSL